MNEAIGGRQPYLHDLVCLVHAPGCVLSGSDGQIRAEGVQGVFVADRRVISRLTVLLDGVQPTHLRHARTGSRTAEFTATARHLDDPHTGPTVVLRRTRTVRPDGVEERFDLSSYAPRDLDVTFELVVGSDMADIADVKAGRPGQDLEANRIAGGLQFAAASGPRIHLSFSAPAEPRPDGNGFLTAIHLKPGETKRITVVAAVEDAGPQVAVPPASSTLWVLPLVEPRESPLGRLVEQSVADLDSLRLADPLSTRDEFFAAGAPWYLALFGRDSLWAARMSLALGTSVAHGTLSALARRQGDTDVADTAEQPGKILHELRRTASSHGHDSRSTQPLTIPATYYGSVDATALWVLLLHDAWRWGLAADAVETLMAPLEDALAWLHTHAPTRLGFLSYHDESGHGLVNQGWKDSHDAIQFSDGEIAKSPIALAEVQGYAHEAALAGASLLEAFGRPAADTCRQFAANLKQAFRRHFWVGDARGSYPAIALDREGRPVDTLTSNIGHLPGTGLLSPAEEAVVARRLLDPALNSGYGLRTLAADTPAHNPLSYHRGSVWVHDTAIAVAGLARSGASPEALASLVTGLLAAAPHFGYQLPELFGGQARADGPPIPYPASCRPQAWAAAAGVLVATTLAGVRPDVPNGRITIEPPLRPSPVGAFALRGLVVGESSLNISVDAGGTATAGWAGKPGPCRIVLGNDVQQVP